MDKQLKDFIYHKNGWSNSTPPVKVNPNIRNEKIGTLWLDGKILDKGNFSLLQRKKSDYCRNYGISKQRANERFKITY